MGKTPPERTTISFPEDSEIDLSTIDVLVEKSECETRSEWIREQLAESTDLHNE